MTSITDISVSKIYVLATEPTNKTKDRFWFDTTNNILKRYDGTTWKPISVSSDSVVVLSDGSKISLTTYLNNQIATLAEGIDTKQNKLKTYSETTPSGSLPSAGINAELGISLDSKIVKIGGGIFDTETIIDGNAKGYPGSSKIRVANRGILLQEVDGDNEGSSIELTQSGLIINSDFGITGNILEKTISGSSTDTQIPTAKSVYTAVNAKANKSTTLSGYGITDTYTKTEVDTKLKDYETKEDFDGYTSMVLSTYQQKTDITLETTNKTIVGSINEINENTSKKQDKLTTYTETPVSDSTGVIGSTVEIAGVAITLNPTNNGSVILHNSITGSAISTSIPTSNAVDTKIPSEKAIRTELNKKQDSSDTSLTTNDKTIVGAINELNNQVNTTIPEPITSIYTIGSTNLTSFISNTTYAGVSGQILISADVSNTGPILVGENISDKTNAFPIYPDQIFPIPFSDINNFKVTGTVNDKFNYIISFRSLSNTSPVANGGITILNENGYYKLTPEGEGDTATLVITKLK